MSWRCAIIRTKIVYR